MTVHRELIIDFSELSQMIISCPKCETRVVIKCGEQESRTPTECPSCAEAYGQGFRDTIRGFRQIYRELSKPGSRAVQFRIASEIHE